jgi:hypothetical protein
MLLPAEPIIWPFGCCEFIGAWICGCDILPPIDALRALLTELEVPFCGDCELRFQLSSSQESCGLAAVLFTSFEFALRRGDDPNSVPREKPPELSRAKPLELLPKPELPELLKLLPLPLLLFALASHFEAQSSLFEADDGCAEFADELKPGCVPRYESVVNEGPLSTGVVLAGANGLVDEGICGASSGGAAMALPMLVQPLPDCEDDGVVRRLRSTGIAGSDELLFQAGAVDAGVAAGAVVTVELAPHGGGATPFREVELAAGVCGEVANGLFDCDGYPTLPTVCCAPERRLLPAACNCCEAELLQLCTCWLAVAGCPPCGYE